VKAVNKVALEVEKDNDDVQKQIQELQRVMEPKRVRTHADTVDDDEECEKQSSDDWDLPDHRREATRVQNHHSIGQYQVNLKFEKKKIYRKSYFK